MYLHTWQHQITTSMWPFHSDLQPQIPKHPVTRTSTSKATLCHHVPPLQCGKKKRQTDRSRTRRTQEVPFIAACSHFTRKNARFCARLPPQNKADKAHATFMQPLQCVLQHHVANLHVSTHMATPDDNNHVAIPLRSATTDSKTPYNYARASTPKATLCHRYSAAKKKANRPQPHPPHRYLSSPLRPLYTEKHKVLCSGFLPKAKPTKPMQHSCSHYNAFAASRG